MTGVEKINPDPLIGLSGVALDRLMPLHVWLSPKGQIVRAGPTFRKMVGHVDIIGGSIFDLMTLKRPRLVSKLPDLMSLQGQRLTLTLNAAPHLTLRGMVVTLPGDTGAFVNISLGVSFAQAVAEWHLTLGDFAPCDQTVDLLYLREAIALTAQESQMLTERLQAARMVAEEQALTDTLTGLANRRAMDMALSRTLSDPQSRYGLMHLDLDYFKQVNDTLGHAAGDHVLTHVAAVLCAELRKSDIVARMGGDEFVMLFQDCDDPDLLERIALRLIDRLEEPTLFQDKTCRISASIGTTLSRYYTNPTVDQLLSDADQALYTSKKRGRARHTFYNPTAMASQVRPG
ncbi:GGDEF domain-containing protein [Rhodophyticola sp. CCM32]|uniref:GGDEF domain-containing protein n=1 Tax=Rhodophyticola sp. CCM32 TaxID=2916397 RepID=UPI00107FCCA8|nr:GGDEF domain-containing protein [Rhodophyticola sp. CCM32]QBY01407.1 GGDEF domain-containing protein [Rhodophyticola sp. CCM32]